MRAKWRRSCIAQWLWFHFPRTTKDRSSTRVCAEWFRGQSSDRHGHSIWNSSRRFPHRRCLLQTPQSSAFTYVSTLHRFHDTSEKVPKVYGRERRCEWNKFTMCCGSFLSNLLSSPRNIACHQSCKCVSSFSHAMAGLFRSHGTTWEFRLRSSCLPFFIPHSTLRSC